MKKLNEKQLRRQLKAAREEITGLKGSQEGVADLSVIAAERDEARAKLAKVERERDAALRCVTELEVEKERLVAASQPRNSAPEIMGRPKRRG